MSEPVNTVQVGCYKLSGDRQGQVTVKNTASGEIVHTFQMDEGIVLREVFILNNGKTIAASQKDHAVFWDLATGKEIRRFHQRIYGFSHDETKFFTYEEKKVFLYVYPEMTLTCQLSEGTFGPKDFQFSPDDHFLVIRFFRGLPADDEYYPRLNPVRKLIVSSKLFKLETCQEIHKFTELRVKKMGQFSDNSNFYNLSNARLWTNRGIFKGSWQFNLTTYEIQLQQT